MAHLDIVSQQPSQPPIEEHPEWVASPTPGQALQQAWSSDPERYQTREVRKARERADRAARRADRAARRLHEAQERAAGPRSGAGQLLGAAGDAATAALTAVSAVADEAQARLAAKARMRELEDAVIAARAGGPVDVTPPTREEALKLADRVDPASPRASVVRGMGFIVAGIVAFAMIQIGGFGWLGFAAPMMILFASGSFADGIRSTDRRRRAGQIQLELARAGLASTEGARGPSMPHAAQGLRPAPTGTIPVATEPVAARRRLFENGDPRTRSEVLAVLDRFVANVRGSLPDADMDTLVRIRHSASLALPTTDEPLDLTDHDTWLLRQICTDYLPGAVEHYIALPSDLASEPVLDGRSARQVLDEQLALIETRLDELATRSYRREANGLLSHARFLADSLRPDPFQARLAELAAPEPEPVRVPVPAPAPAAEASVTRSETTARVRERA
jgi:hypothetical protein